MKRIRLKGAVAAMITPMSASGDAIDEGALRTYCRFLADKGLGGVFVSGTTGEFAALDGAERRRLAEITTEELGSTLPVIVHTGAMNTADTVSLSRHAREVGAAGVAIVTPWYYALDDDALLAHFTTVAEAVPELPVWLYHIPSNARNSVTPAVLQKLTERCGNVVGIKDSGGDLTFFTTCLETVPGLNALNGSDALAVASLSVGGDGMVSGNASAFPEILVGLYHAFVAGNLVEARRFQRLVNRLRRLLKDGAHLAYFKEALALRGVPVGTTRWPRPRLTEEEVTVLRQGLTALGNEFPDLMPKLKTH